MNRDDYRIILQYSYWEHFKKAKDLALVLKPEDEKLKVLTDEIEVIRKKIEELGKAT